MQARRAYAPLTLYCIERITNEGTTILGQAAERATCFYRLHELTIERAADYLQFFNSISKVEIQTSLCRQLDPISQWVIRPYAHIQDEIRAAAPSLF